MKSKATFAFRAGSFMLPLSLSVYLSNASGVNASSPAVGNALLAVLAQVYGNEFCWWCFSIDWPLLLQVVPLWRQRAGRDEEKLVIWDYHVIFIYKPDERCLVFDLDSDLPFPTYFHKYVTETFRTDAILNPEYHRFFRVIAAGQFLQTFASDRRHMKKPDGTWMKPPPPYPCIMPPRFASFLAQQLISVTQPFSLQQWQQFHNSAQSR